MTDIFQDTGVKRYVIRRRENFYSPWEQAEGLPPHGERSEVKSIMNLYRSGPQCCGPLFSITKEVESPCGTAIGSTSTRML